MNSGQLHPLMNRAGTQHSPQFDNGLLTQQRHPHTGPRSSGAPGQVAVTTAGNHSSMSPVSMESDDGYLQWGGGGGEALGLPKVMLGLGEEAPRIKTERVMMDSDDVDSMASPGNHSHSPGNLSHSPGNHSAHSPGIIPSPARSPNNGQTHPGDVTMETGSVKRRKDKSAGSAGKSIEEELCLICGDRASGYHYNALSCEGCKGFFRRSITRGSVYQCKYGGNCEMDMWMRRKCQACRLRRCREVGMKEECLLSDDQCKARDVRRKARQKLQKMQSSSSSPSGVEMSESALEVQHSPDSNTLEPALQDLDLSAVNPLDCMTADNRELLEILVYNQDKYELPSEENIKKVSAINLSDLGRPKDMSQSIYKVVAEMTILTTQLVVEFAKRIPGFSSLNRDDQIILLKGSASEVMILRTARRYDLESGTIVLGNGMPIPKDYMQMAGLHEYFEHLFIFCRRMAVLAVDNAEYALITSLSILTERPGLNEPALIEKLHDTYLHCLLDYNKYRRPKGSNFLAKLLMKFTELQSVSDIHAKSLYELKLEKVTLPPLLSEYFDVMD